MTGRSSDGRHNGEWPVCHNDFGRSSDGERPVFLGTMTVGDLVMVNGLCL